ncbi:MAG: MBL fold metallo-hydrolase [Desulfobacteraceae bacterium]|nr:MBL fold metallo-hydrolase [Desulfobacteraceae bacterium]
MYIRFWGVRGSVATPLTNAELVIKIKTVLKMALEAGLTSDSQIPSFISNLPKELLMTAGGDSACVEIRTGDQLIILDAGTGIRQLGLNLMQKAMGNPVEAHILISHTHWDHICGIPFFVPGYNPRNNLFIYSTYPDMKDRLDYQQYPRYFPVPLGHAFKFVTIEKQGVFRIGSVKIETSPLNHPGKCFGFRIASKGKTVVYATDSEYKNLSADALKPFTDFFHGADLLIYDAQYTMLENIEKENWGHSNVFTGIDMAIKAEVKKLAFIHHEPAYNDLKLWGMLQKAKEYAQINRAGKKLQLYLAFEGARIRL